MPSDYLYLPGSALEVPGIEAVFEYGNASDIDKDRIPGAVRINDRSRPDQVHISEISGLHDDPDARDSRSPLADIHGESAGLMLYSGKTIGLTGRVQAGNVHRMRDLWRMLRSQFGTNEKDLIIHPPAEVAISYNEITNPSLRYSTAGWTAITGTLVGAIADGIGGDTFGRITSTALTSGAAEMSNRITWGGDDVFVSADVKIASATGTVSVITLSLVCTHADNTTTTIDVAQSGPVPGRWYRIASRILASSIAADVKAVHLRIAITGLSSANYVTLFGRTQLTLLDPSQFTPHHFDGDVAGFEWEGALHGSRSFGPSYSVNLITDPAFKYAADNPPFWSSMSGTGVVVNTIAASSKFSGVAPKSLYVKLTKDATAAARDMTVKSYDPSTTNVAVEQLRSYRFTLSVKTLQAPPTGTLRAAITWLDSTGATISTDQGDAIATSDTSATIAATAPAQAYWAIPRFGVFSSTTSSSVLEFFLTDACMLDITDYDGSDFYGVGEPSAEVASYVSLSPARVELARRRIPRPFLIEGVRKTSDAKAPEQQTNLQARRPFTMSLRAADPRIYCLDTRRNTLRLSGSPQFFSTQSEVFTHLDESQGAGTEAPVPTGYTYDGQHFATIAEAGPTIYTYGVWTKHTTYPSVPAGSTFHPNNGVGLGMWRKGDNSVVLDSQRPGPPVDIIARVYRSLEGYTYTNPRVVAGCSPTSTTQDFAAENCQGRGWVFDAAGRIQTNYFSILIKRVSATTWLELRWQPTTSVGAGTDSLGQTFYAFELWCSHTTSGVNTTTRIAQWDYVSYDSATLDRLPWEPTTNPRWLTATLSSDVLTWELWSTYPPPPGISSAGLIETQSYTLSASLITLLGSAVAGSPGWVMKVASGNTLAILDSFDQTAGNLTGKVTKVGAQTWTAYMASTSGVDFTVDATNHIATRSVQDTSSTPTRDGRGLTAGTSSYGAVTATADIRWAQSGLPSSGPTTGTGILFRSVSTPSLTGMVVARSITAPIGDHLGYTIGITTGGSGSGSIAFAANTWYTMTLSVSTSGRLQAWWNVRGAALGSPVLDITDARLAGGGTMQTGKVGIYDENLSGVTFARDVDNFNVYGSDVELIPGSAGYSCEPWWMTGGNTPFLHYFEASDGQFAVQSMVCNVIGDVDTPPTITLKGGLINPVITMTTTDDRGGVVQSQARFIGTFADNNPAIVDVASGTITDGTGSNIYRLLQPGSNFLNLRPGTNIVSVQASDWDAAALNHIEVSWRDALI